MDCPVQMVLRRQLEARIAIRRRWALYEVSPTPEALHHFAEARALLEEWT